ncbi:RICIN domain-containing protein [Tunicatimonas pelagia]|uniref:RICIN domain-containing protein n=1 Tax=Tunicatimonas pelagia TaxID=931531 RepID=UPI002666547D|nr:RICIN domain-containing protein [Tunicatimonas pelagia]WKN44945.1 RICIN domain-containing protein [Tunicatimonas pelagia]
MKNIQTTISTLATLVLIFCGFVVHATDYWVKTNGNDNTGNGTEAKPWRTVKYATTRVTNPNDRIRVGAGTFKESTMTLASGVDLIGNGKSSSSRTVLSFTSETLIYGRDLDGNRIAHLEINGNQRTGSNGLFVRDVQDFTVEHVAFNWISNTSLLLRGELTNVTVDRCDFYNFVKAGIDYGTAFVANRSKGIYITNSSFVQDVHPNPSNPSERVGVGIQFYGGRHWLDEIAAHLVEDLIVDNCTFEIFPGQFPFSLEYFNITLKNSEIRNCTFIHSQISLSSPHAPRFAPEPITNAIRVHHNRWEMNDNASFVWSCMETRQFYLEFDHNYINGSSFSMVFNNAGSSQNESHQSYHHNVFNMYYPRTFCRMNGPATDWKFFNNTIYSTYSGNINNQPFLFEGDPGEWTNFQIKNNILEYALPGKVRLFKTNNVNAPGLEVTNNTYQNVDMNHSRVTGNYNERAGLLLSGSKPYPFFEIDDASFAHDRGVDVGLPFSGNAPDIGAYEVQSDVSGSVAGTYKLIARHSDKALAVDTNPATNGGFSNARSNGVNVFQYGTNDAENRQWEITPVGEGYYKIVSKYSGKALDVRSWSTANGGNVQQWAYNDNDNQQWKIEPSGEGYYTLTARHSGKVLDVWTESTEDGANVQQWTSFDKANQQWQLVRINDTNARRTTSVGKTGLAEEVPGVDKQLTLYPNPAHSEVRVQLFDEQSAAQLRVLDLTGRVVLEKWLARSQTVGIQTLPKGLYTVLVRQGAVITTQKLLIE